MSSGDSQSAIDVKESKKNEERTVQELRKRIEDLRKFTKRLFDKNLKLQEQLCAYKQQNGVPGGVGDPSDETTGLELSGSPRKERAYQVQRQLERSGIKDNVENFVENFYQKEREITSFMSEREKLKESFAILAEENVNLKNQLGKLFITGKKMIDYNFTLQEDKEWLAAEVKYYKDKAEKDNKDGANWAEEKEIASQEEPDALAGFVNPFNCLVSCVPSVVFFIFYKMELQVCNRRSIMEMQYSLSSVSSFDDEVSKDDGEVSKDDGEVSKDDGEVSKDVGKVGKCSLSLNDFRDVDLIEKDSTLSTEIANADEILPALQKALDKVKGQSHPALLVMYYNKKQEGKKRAGHCIALMDDCTFIDVQMRRSWDPKHDKRLKSVGEIEVWQVKKGVAKEWEDNCGLKKCKIECIVCTSL